MNQPTVNIESKEALKLRIALVGNPNCGKSALFNALTGLRQKVANYPGATVERRSGPVKGYKDVTVVDLPGTYSLSPKSPDEAVTHDTLMGLKQGEPRPDLIIAVVDATNLAQHLRFTIELTKLGLPMVLALNMTDLAKREEIELDRDALEHKLGIPVIDTVAVRRKGLDTLVEKAIETGIHNNMPVRAFSQSLQERTKQAQAIAREVTLKTGIGHQTTRILDNLFLNPFIGPVILFGLLFLMFQAVFSWAEAPMDWIEGQIGAAQTGLSSVLSEGWLLSLLSDGILAGVGAVVVFLPQIIILFAFILTLESTGYMARAAFLMDRLMAKVGLNGRAFIPLLSSFACAVPGIMAARTIADEKDRMTTILIAPLMTCSARLPVYTVIIAAFIPNQLVGGIGLQGLVMFGLYMAGIVSALIIAFIFRRTLTKGVSQPFLMELPKYQIPDPRFILVGVIERAKIFLKRAGTIILFSVMILWALASVPLPPEGATEPAIFYSLVGSIGRGLEMLLSPIGFNWEISVALVPGLAAREVAIAALGTVYSLSGNEEVIAAGLVSTLQNAWPLPTALSFLAWYIFAPQCLSTIAVTRRETNSWRWPIFMIVYLFALAYAASFITYRVASLFL